MTWQLAGGQVRRIAYTGGANRAPTAVAEATPTAGALPLTVDFDGTASSDPDGDPLTLRLGLRRRIAASRPARRRATPTRPRAHTRRRCTVRDRGRRAEHRRRCGSTPATTPPVPTIDVARDGAALQRRRADRPSRQRHRPRGRARFRTARSDVGVDRAPRHPHPPVPARPRRATTSRSSVRSPRTCGRRENSYLEVFLTATDSDGPVHHGDAGHRSEEGRPQLQHLAGGPSASAGRNHGHGAAHGDVVGGLGRRIPCAAARRTTPPACHGVSPTGTMPARRRTRSRPRQPGQLPRRLHPAAVPAPGGATPLRVPLVPAFRQCTDPDSSHVPPLAEPPAATRRSSRRF